METEWEKIPTSEYIHLIESIFGSISAVSKMGGGYAE
jgi:hypothetical protein